MRFSSSRYTSLSGSNVLRALLIEFGVTYQGKLAGQPRIADIFGREALSPMDLLRAGGPDQNLSAKEQLREVGSGT
jgi:hypothetical protein